MLRFFLDTDENRHRLLYLSTRLCDRFCWSIAKIIFDDINYTTIQKKLKEGLREHVVELKKRVAGLLIWNAGKH